MTLEQGDETMAAEAVQKTVADDKQSQMTRVSLWCVPPGLMTGLRLATAMDNSVMTQDSVEDVPHTAAAKDAELAPSGSQAAVGEEDLELTISSRMSCSQCGVVSFTDRGQQTTHYKSDWHRYNLRRHLRGLSPLGEEQFEEVMGDVSSISGSDTESSSSDEEEVRDATKQTKMAGDMPTVAPQLPKQPKVSPIPSKATRHPRIFFHNKDGELFSLFRCLLHQKRNAPESELELPALAEDLPSSPTWTIIMLAAGHFAAAVFNGNDVLVHKTFHRYVVRAKRGTAQSTQDNKGQAARSAGARLRRYNEAALKQDIESLVEDWRDHINKSSLVFLRVPRGNNAVLTAGGRQPVLTSADPRLRTAPFPTRRPTMREVKRVHASLAEIHCYGADADVNEHLAGTVKSSPTKVMPVTELPQPGFNVQWFKKKKRQKPQQPQQHQEDVPVPSDSSDEEDGDDGEVLLRMCEEMHQTSGLSEFGVDWGVEKQQDSKADTQESQETSQHNDRALGTSSSPRNRKQKKKQPSKQKIKQEAEEEVLDEYRVQWRNKLFTACKTGDIAMVTLLLEQGIQSEGDRPVDSLPAGLSASATVISAVLNLGFGESGGTLLHVASRSSQPEACHSLMDAGADPACRDRRGHVPYSVAGDRATRDEFRRYMAQHPEKYDYTQAKVPGPLTEDMDNERKSHEAERRKIQRQARKQKMQVKKLNQKEQKAQEEAEQREEAEKQRFLALSDREKRALAAERRLVAQMEVASTDVPTLSRCYQCGVDITGKVPFEYSEYRFCTTKCLQLHRKQNKTS